MSIETINIARSFAATITPSTLISGFKAAQLTSDAI
jgi:hypothetical protein